MKKTLLLICFLVHAAAVICWAQSKPADLKLWYNEPAKVWTEALPVGNGRLGAMVFGKVDNELIQLNEETLWSGGPANLNPNPEAPRYLPQIREAIFKGDYKTAEALCHKVQGLYTESYQPLGDLLIRQRFSGEASAYYRDLDLTTATTVTRFTVNGSTYTREVLASAPDQVILIRLRVAGKGKINTDVATSSLLRFQKTTSGTDEIVMSGKAPAHADPNYVRYNPEPVVYDDASGCRGMRYQLRVKAKLKGHQKSILG